MIMPVEHWKRFALSALVAGSGLCARAATTGVNVGDDFFSPATVTINVSDQVKWTWIGVISHSSTSDTNGLWDSGINGNGFTFTHSFTTAGTFPYHCNVHSFQKGTVTVQAANVPPSVAITAPTNGTLFSAPWTGVIQATASDTDDTVTKVDFFAGTTLLGTVSNPPASLGFNVTNLAAGSYTLKAVATDSRGATNSSAGVSITVVTPAVIQLSAPQRTSPTSFQFSYSATPGLSYVVQRSADFSNWTPLSTNTAASSPVSFTDNSASGGVEFYRVHLLPNP